ncbi:MAG: methionyl-tRNA formyltransferase [Undibacterium sp.]|nr:methionyl-tRNA formyltransferase [Opitutaceae bacterium]
MSQPAPLRLVFLGSDSIAMALLDWFVSDAGRVHAEVVGVFTQPDRPVGRGQKITPNAIKTWALARGLPVLQPEKVTDEVRAQLAALTPDVSLVMAYGHILRDAFIAAPRLGTLNLHTSLLPKYRGASPIQTAIASGERETGVTLMRIVRELDAGPLADAERVTIGALDTAPAMEAKLAAACVPLVARSLPRLAAGELGFIEQNHAGADYCRRLEKNDGVLDFAAPAAVLAARINGLFPWPTCSLMLLDQPVKIGLADVVENFSPATPAATPGMIIGADSHGLQIAAADGVLRLRQLQRPGGRMLPAGEFLRGFSVTVGTTAASHLMPPLLSPTPFPRR